MTEEMYNNLIQQSKDRWQRLSQKETRVAALKEECVLCSFFHCRYCPVYISFGEFCTFLAEYKAWQDSTGLLKELRTAAKVAKKHDEIIPFEEYQRRLLAETNNRHS